MAGELTRAVQRTGGLKSVVDLFKNIQQMKAKRDAVARMLDTYKTVQNEINNLGQPNNDPFISDVEKYKEAQDRYNKAQQLQMGFLSQLITEPGTDYKKLNALNQLLGSKVGQFKPPSFQRPDIKVLGTDVEDGIKTIKYGRSPDEITKLDFIKLPKKTTPKPNITQVDPGKDLYINGRLVRKGKEKIDKQYQHKIKEKANEYINDIFSISNLDYKTTKEGEVITDPVTNEPMKYSTEEKKMLAEDNLRSLRGALLSPRSQQFVNQLEHTTKKLGKVLTPQELAKKIRKDLADGKLTVDKAEELRTYALYYGIAYPGIKKIYGNKEEK